MITLLLKILCFFGHHNYEPRYMKWYKEGERQPIMVHVMGRCKRCRELAPIPMEYERTFEQWRSQLQTGNYIVIEDDRLVRP